MVERNRSASISLKQRNARQTKQSIKISREREPYNESSVQSDHSSGGILIGTKVHLHKRSDSFNMSSFDQLKPVANANVATSNADLAKQLANSDTNLNHIQHNAHQSNTTQVFGKSLLNQNNNNLQYLDHQSQNQISMLGLSSNQGNNSALMMILEGKRRNSREAQYFTEGFHQPHINQILIQKQNQHANNRQRQMNKDASQSYPCIDSHEETSSVFDSSQQQLQETHQLKFATAAYPNVNQLYAADNMSTKSVGVQNRRKDSNSNSSAHSNVFIRKNSQNQLVQTSNELLLDGRNQIIIEQTSSLGLSNAKNKSSLTLYLNQQLTNNYSGELQQESAKRIDYPSSGNEIDLQQNSTNSQYKEPAVIVSEVETKVKKQKQQIITTSLLLDQNSNIQLGSTQTFGQTRALSKTLESSNIVLNTTDCKEPENNDSSDYKGQETTNQTEPNQILESMAGMSKRPSVIQEMSSVGSQNKTPIVQPDQQQFHTLARGTPHEPKQLTASRSVESELMLQSNKGAQMRLLVSVKKPIELSRQQMSSEYQYNPDEADNFERDQRHGKFQKATRSPYSRSSIASHSRPASNNTTGACQKVPQIKSKRPSTRANLYVESHSMMFRSRRQSKDFRGASQVTNQDFTISSKKEIPQIKVNFGGLNPGRKLLASAKNPQRSQNKTKANANSATATTSKIYQLYSRSKPVSPPEPQILIDDEEQLALNNGDQPTSDKDEVKQRQSALTTLMRHDARKIINQNESFFKQKSTLASPKPSSVRSSVRSSLHNNGNREEAKLVVTKSAATLSIIGNQANRNLLNYNDKENLQDEITVGQSTFVAQPKFDSIDSARNGYPIYRSSQHTKILVSGQDPDKRLEKGAKTKNLDLNTVQQIADSGKINQNQQTRNTSLQAVDRNTDQVETTFYQIQNLNQAVNPTHQRVASLSQEYQRPRIIPPAMHGYIRNHINRIPYISQDEIDRQKLGTYYAPCQIVEDYNADIQEETNTIQYIYAPNQMTNTEAEQQTPLYRVNTASASVENLQSIINQTRPISNPKSAELMERQVMQEQQDGDVGAVGYRPSSQDSRLAQKEAQNAAFLGSGSARSVRLTPQFNHSSGHSVVPASRTRQAALKNRDRSFDPRQSLLVKQLIPQGHMQPCSETVDQPQAKQNEPMSAFKSSQARNTVASQQTSNIKVTTEVFLSKVRMLSPEAQNTTSPHISAFPPVSADRSITGEDISIADIEPPQKKLGNGIQITETINIKRRDYTKPLVDDSTGKKTLDLQQQHRMSVENDDNPKTFLGFKVEDTAQYGSKQEVNSRVSENIDIVEKKLLQQKSMPLDSTSMKKVTKKMSQWEAVGLKHLGDSTSSLDKRSNKSGDIIEHQKTVKLRQNQLNSNSGELIQKSQIGVQPIEEKVHQNNQTTHTLHDSVESKIQQEPTVEQKMKLLRPQKLESLYKSQNEQQSQHYQSTLMGTVESPFLFQHKAFNTKQQAQQQQQTSNNNNNQYYKVNEGGNLVEITTKQRRRLSSSQSPAWQNESSGSCNDNYDQNMKMRQVPHGVMQFSKQHNTSNIPEGIRRDKMRIINTRNGKPIESTIINIQQNSQNNQTRGSSYDNRPENYPHIHDRRESNASSAFTNFNDTAVFTAKYPKLQNNNNQQQRGVGTQGGGAQQRNNGESKATKQSQRLINKRGSNPLDDYLMVGRHYNQQLRPSTQIKNHSQASRLSSQEAKRAILQTNIDKENTNNTTSENNETLSIRQKIPIVKESDTKSSTFLNQNKPRNDQDSQTTLEILNQNQIAQMQQQQSQQQQAQLTQGEQKTIQDKLSSERKLLSQGKLVVTDREQATEQVSKPNSTTTYSHNEYVQNSYQSAFLNRHERLKLQQLDMKATDALIQKRKTVLSAKPSKSMALLEEERLNKLRNKQALKRDVKFACKRSITKIKAKLHRQCEQSTSLQRLSSKFTTQQQVIKKLSVKQAAEEVTSRIRRQSGSTLEQPFNLQKIVSISNESDNVFNDKIPLTRSVIEQMQQKSTFNSTEIQQNHQHVIPTSTIMNINSDYLQKIKQKNIPTSDQPYAAMNSPKPYQELKPLQSLDQPKDSIISSRLDLAAVSQTPMYGEHSRLQYSISERQSIEDPLKSWVEKNKSRDDSKGGEYTFHGSEQVLPAQGGKQVILPQDQVVVSSLVSSHRNNEAQKALQSLKSVLSQNAVVQDGSRKPSAQISRKNDSIKNSKNSITFIAVEGIVESQINNQVERQNTLKKQDSNIINSNSYGGVHHRTSTELKQNSSMINVVKSIDSDLKSSTRPFSSSTFSGVVASKKNQRHLKYQGMMKMKRRDSYKDTQFVHRESIPSEGNEAIGTRIGHRSSIASSVKKERRDESFWDKK